MRKNDLFQYQRAIESKAWLSHPDRIIENALDQKQRFNADIKLGHSTKCTLTKCADDCKRGLK